MAASRHAGGNQCGTVIGVLPTVQREDQLLDLRTETKVTGTTTCTMQQSGIAFGDEARSYNQIWCMTSISRGGLFCGETLPKMLLKNTDTISFCCAHSQDFFHLRGYFASDTSS
jgi:hypothetical protein